MQAIKNLFHLTRSFLAKHWLKIHPNVLIIGVTGSYGKTNSVVATAQVLSEKFKTLRTDVNLDPRFSIPMTILKLRDQKILILEMAVDGFGQMDSYLSLAKPKAGILTGITPVHADLKHLGSLEGIIKEKGKLLEALPEGGWAVLN